MKRGKVAAIGCGAVLVLIALAFAFLNYAMFGDHSYHATDVPQHELAPASATSIEVFEMRNLSGVVCVTYQVSEEDFRKFAAEKGWPLSPGTGPILVRSPSNYEGPVKTVDAASFLRYERRQSNGGGITVFYIPAESRAYIDKSNR